MLCHAIRYNLKLLKTDQASHSGFISNIFWQGSNNSNKTVSNNSNMSNTNLFVTCSDLNKTKEFSPILLIYLHSVAY